MQQITKQDAAKELLRRRKARTNLQDFICYLNPDYIVSDFSRRVCAEIDRFLDDLNAGKRPLLVLQAPPQHGKSDIVSRYLPAYMLGRWPDKFVGLISYSSDLASDFAKDVREKLASSQYRKLFPPTGEQRKYSVDRADEVTAPNGAGSLISRGATGGLTGRPLSLAIIDDIVKNHEEALSEADRKKKWGVYETSIRTRRQEKSGVIVMATSWHDDDMPSRVIKQSTGKPNFKLLRFPAINLPGETGYNPELAEGALVAGLKSLEFLQEQKNEMSKYWWDAMYQQQPHPPGGNIFIADGVQYWSHATLPEKFDKIVISWDCTFKEAETSDFVSGQVWAKKGEFDYLLARHKDRMTFTDTVRAVINLKKAFSKAHEILIEDKANGPAVIDVLKSQVPGVIAVEPDGSKEARAHAITNRWEARQIFLPPPEQYPWVKDFIGEILGFPGLPHDDDVDSMTQAIRRLHPLRGNVKVNEAAILKAMGLK